MPKGPSKAKRSKGSKRDRRAEPDDGDEDLLSGAGSISTTSTASLDTDEDVGGEIELIDDLRSRVDECITETEGKSGKTRLKGIEGLYKILSQRYAPDCMDAMQETLLTCVQRLLRRDCEGERIAALRLLGVIFLQLGESEETTRCMNEVTPLLRTVFQDHTKGQQLRSMCGRILTLGTFISGDLPDYIEVTDLCEATLSSSIHPCRDLLWTTVMENWACLLSLMPSSLVFVKAERLICLFMPRLASSDAATRLSAGEAIASVYEVCQQQDPLFFVPCLHEVIEQVKELATDHSHHRSKAEKKEGRASFRRILRFLTEEEPPEDKVQLCKRQTLRMTTWADLQRFSMMKHILGGGIKDHLLENTFVRDVFGLGAPLGEVADKELYTKEERKCMHAATKQYRQTERALWRDKRSAVF